MKNLLMLTLGAALTASVAAGPVPDSLYRLYATRDFAGAELVLAQLGEQARPADLFAVRLEQADFLLDKQGDYAAAEAIYRRLLDEFPKAPQRPELGYRLALALELQEKYLDAAQQYEIVATRHMDSRFGEDALDAIERCFRKNYQDRVAYVDGYPLTRIELDDRISRNPAGYEPFERKEFLLDTMVDNRLLYRAALDAGLMADPDFAEPYWDMRNRYVFEQWHARTVTAHAEPTERNLRDAYNREKSTRFTTPEKVHGWRLVVPDRALADSLRRLLLGADAVPWETLAARFSTAPDKDRGGDLGLFARGTRDKAIEDAAFRLKPGQVSRAVPLDTGWALVRVTERTPRKVTPYAEARNQLVAQVRQRKTEELYDQRTAELTAAAGIEIDTAALDEGRDIIGSVDGVTITSELLAKRLEQIPVFFRAQFQTPEGIRRILEQFVLEQLILKDAEANHDWLANGAVDRILDRRSRMLVDHYTRRMTIDNVTIDTAEVRAEYRATLEEHKVPARVRAREIVAPTRPRAELLRRWAVSGSLPELVSGRALLLAGADDDILAELAGTEDPDALVTGYGFTEAPRAVLPGTPTLRIGNRLLPDMTRRCPVAGPYAGTGAFGMAFNDVSPADTIFLPTLLHARDGKELAALFNTAPEYDQAGTVLVDENRLGAYVGFERPLAAAAYRELLATAEGELAAPLATDDGRLHVRITGREAAAPAEFEEIARRFSSAASRHSGGDLSWFERDDESRDQQVIEAAFRLGAGSISPLIRVNDSTWAFIKVEEKQAAYTRPFDEVAAGLESKLRTRESERLRGELLTGLRATANIEKLMKPEDFIFDTGEDEPLPDAAGGDATDE
ncbi:MAG: peptidyl-prolyl cis-trans isomerase [bacterium]